MSRTYPRVGVRRERLTVATATLLLAFSASTDITRAQSPQTLDIYWIDVEGGAATLVVTPQGESVLMDAGWPRPDFRDTDRIQAAMQDAGITTIDYLLISHFHTDHVGGLPQLAERVPIGQVIDHGDSVEQDGAAGLTLWHSYEAVADGRRRTVGPGDKLPLQQMEFSFVAAHRQLVESPERRRPNRRCDTATPPAVDEGENGHSLGYLLSLGAFQFLNMGDLTPDREYALACPENRLGVVDLWQVPHHGGYGAIRPELAGALEPTVAVINNGPRKGGTLESLASAHFTAGVGDVWQSHRALSDAEAMNTDVQLIANLTEEEDCEGHWIKATVQADGRAWTMTNARTGYSRNYQSK